MPRPIPVPAACALLLATACAHAGTPVARIPSDLKTGALRYMPLAHPDLIPEKKSVIVSYSQNNTNTQEVENDPFLYRPAFLRVNLPR